MNDTIQMNINKPNSILTHVYALTDNKSTHETNINIQVYIYREKYRKSYIIDSSHTRAS